MMSYVGYQSDGKGDKREGLYFHKPGQSPDSAKPLWSENQWPKVHRFREKYEKWIAKMRELGLIVMEA
jgi:isopenicillin N synthase-like dioxygenase